MIVAFPPLNFVSSEAITATPPVPFKVILVSASFPTRLTIPVFPAVLLVIYIPIPAVTSSSLVAVAPFPTVICPL